MSNIPGTSASASPYAHFSSSSSSSSSFTKAAMTYGEWRRLNEKAQEDMSLFDRLEELAPNHVRIPMMQNADERFVPVPSRSRDPLGLEEIPVRNRDPLGLEEIPVRNRDPLGLEDEPLTVKQNVPKGSKSPAEAHLGTVERSKTPELPEALRKPPPPLAPLLLLNLKQELLD